MLTGYTSSYATAISSDGKYVAGYATKTITDQYGFPETVTEPFLYQRWVNGPTWGTWAASTPSATPVNTSGDVVGYSTTKASGGLGGGDDRCLPLYRLGRYPGSQHVDRRQLEVDAAGRHVHQRPGCDRRHRDRTRQQRTTDSCSTRRTTGAEAAEAGAVAAGANPAEVVEAAGLTAGAGAEEEARRKPASRSRPRGPDRGGVPHEDDLVGAAEVGDRRPTGHPDRHGQVRRPSRGVPTGLVTFLKGTTALGTVPLSAARPRWSLQGSRWGPTRSGCNTRRSPASCPVNRAR